MNNYDVDFFIRKFSAIPDERWTRGSFAGLNNRHCALGHCGVRMVNRAITWTPEGDALNDIIGSFPGVPAINDHAAKSGLHNFPGDTPRARILAALHDAKSKAESALEAYETRPLLPVTKPKPVEVV